MMSVFVLGVDTNILVRFLADDDDVQTPLAARLLTDPAHHPVRVSVVTLIETYWVLTRVKKFPASAVMAAFRNLLLSDEFEIEQAEIVSAALDAAEAAGCDMPDAVIALSNLAAGYPVTATFDKRAQRLPQMQNVEDLLR